MATVIKPRMEICSIAADFESLYQQFSPVCKLIEGKGSENGSMLSTSTNMYDQPHLKPHNLSSIMHEMKKSAFMNSTTSQGSKSGETYARDDLANSLVTRPSPVKRLIDERVPSNVDSITELHGLPNSTVDLSLSNTEENTSFVDDATADSYTDEKGSGTSEKEKVRLKQSNSRENSKSKLIEGNGSRNGSMLSTSKNMFDQPHMKIHKLSSIMYQMKQSAGMNSTTSQSSKLFKHAGGLESGEICVTDNSVNTLVTRPSPVKRLIDEMDPSDVDSMNELPGLPNSMVDLSNEEENTSFGDDATADSCTDEKDISEKQKVSMKQSNTRKSSKSKEVVLTAWTVKPLGKGICVEGVIGHSARRMAEDQLWHSSNIVQRYSARKVITSSKSVYKLIGPVYKAAMKEAGYIGAVIQKFTHGFPKDWENLLGMNISHLRTSSHEHNDKNKNPRKKPKDRSLATPVQKNEDLADFPITRSGRRVFPPMKFWNGERLAYRIDDFSITFEKGAAEDDSFLNHKKNISRSQSYQRGRKQSEKHPDIKQITKQSRKSSSDMNGVKRKAKSLRHSVPNYLAHAGDLSTSETDGSLHIKPNRELVKQDACSKLQENENKKPDEKVLIISSDNGQDAEPKQRKNMGNKSRLRAKRGGSLKTQQTARSQQFKSNTIKHVKISIDGSCSSDQRQDEHIERTLRTRPTRGFSPNPDEQTKKRRSERLYRRESADLDTHQMNYSKRKSHLNHNKSALDDIIAGNITKKPARSETNLKSRLMSTHNEDAKQRNNKKCEPEDKQENEENVRWTKEELVRLNTALRSVNVDAEDYWECIANIVKTRTRNECKHQHYSSLPENTLKKPKQSSAVCPNKLPAQLSGRAGTLKRKRQLRELIVQQEQDYDDDLFDTTPFKQNKKFKLPNLADSGEDSLSLGVSRAITPYTASSRTPRFPTLPMPVSLKRTPHYTRLSNDGHHALNRNEMDRYVNICKVKPRGKAQKTLENSFSTPLRSGKNIPAVSSSPQLSGSKFYLKSLAQQDETEDEEDFYFSDH